MTENKKIRANDDGNSNPFNNEFTPAGSQTGNDVRNNRGINAPHDVGTSYGAAGTNATDNDTVQTDGNKNV